MSKVPAPAVEGLLVRERHVANMVRELTLRGDDDEMAVLLDAERFAQTAVWMTIKKARQLLYPGVRLRIVVEKEKKEDEEKEKDSSIKFYARSIQILSVHPSTPYLARVLSFSMDQLRQLFPDRHQQQQSSAPALPLPLLAAFAPVEMARLSQAHAMVQAAKQAGQQCNLFKDEQLKEMSAEIFAHLEADNDLIRPKPTGWHPPSVSKETFQALDRFEELWQDRLTCRETGQQPMAAAAAVATATTTTTIVNSGTTPHHHHLLDPLHNLPDPTDERRRRYIDERKRPQIQCMLQLLQDLLSKRTSRCGNDKSSRRSIHIVDVGGGRGYLGLAIAGTFPETHVTIVDNNPTSLEAGRERASLVQLGNISFVLCDLNDADQVAGKVLDKSLDLVAGLHCCGGLAEAAVELAIRAGADFCVSTCCFRSNPSLASLTRLSEQMIGDEREQYAFDVQKVATLAVTVGAKRQDRAIRAYNNMRLCAAEKRSHSSSDKSTSKDRFHLEAWQEQFPLEFSVQNAVLMGRHVARVEQQRAISR